MPSNSFVLAVPSSLQADTNVALQALGHGENNLSVTLFRAGEASHGGGHIYDPVTPEAPDGYLATRWRGMPQPPGGWGQYGLSPSRINQIRGAMLYSVHRHDAGLSSGAEHFNEFCAANDFTWRGAMSPLPLGPLAAGAYHVWRSVQRQEFVVYVLTSHERVVDTDPSGDPALYRVTAV